MTLSSIIDTFNLQGTDCHIVRGQYANNRRLSVRLEAADTVRNVNNYHFPGTPVATLSVNIDSVELAKDEFIFKNYNENTGIFEVMLEAGLVCDTGRRIDVGFSIDVPIVTLTS